MTTTIELDTSEIDQAFSQLIQSTSDLYQPLDEIGDAIEQHIALLFVDQKDPYGEPWKPLKHRDGEPLNDTGVLKNSFTHNVNGDSVEIGTNVDYAVVHQFGAVKGSLGGGNPWGDVPARPFLPEETLPNDWADEVMEIISDHIAL